MRHDKIELSDITPKFDKSIIELYKNKASIGYNKIGTLNYIIDEEKMYITKQPKGHKAKKTGKFDEILTRNSLGVVSEDVIIDGDLTVNDFTINGDMTDKKFKNITIERPIIEINANEREDGLSLKRAGLNINRGLAGSANIFYDETSDGFLFCLDENINNESFSHTTIKQYSNKLIPTNNKQIFKIPDPIRKDEVSMIFINSIKILEEDEYVIDYKKQEVEILEPILKGTELSILNFKLRQFDTIGQEIKDTQSKIEKFTYSTVIEKHHENEIIISLTNDSLPEGEIKSIDNTIMLVFLNGTFLSPKYYTISNHLGDRGVLSFTREINGKDFKVDEGSQIYFVAFSPSYAEKENRIVFTTDDKKISTPEVRQFVVNKKSDKFVLPLTIEKENTGIVFVNSILLDTDDYEIEENMLYLRNIELDIGTIVEIVKIDAYTTSPDLDTLSYLLNKEDFKVLMELTEDEVLIVDSIDANRLIIHKEADISNLVARQKRGSQYAIKTHGDVDIDGKIKISDLAEFKDEVDFRDRIYTHERTTHYDDVIHSKPYLYLNDALDAQDGGIIFERDMAPHAIIKWKENVRRWYAGIEGTERPIVTQDSLELILEKLMDLAGIDLDVHTSVKINHQEEILTTRTLEKDESWFFTFPKKKDTVLLVFMNGRYISEDEYEYSGDQVFFNASINQGTFIHFVEITLNQVSLTGYPIKEELSLNKEYITVKAKNKDHTLFEIPYSISEHNNANIFFLNGILLTKDLYNINGNLLTLNFKPQDPTEITIITLNVTKGATVSKVNLVNRHMKIKAVSDSQKEFILPGTLRKEKDNFLVFCNTTYIPNHLYEIKDRRIKLVNIEENFVNPPTEIIIVELLPVTQRQFNCGGKGTGQTHTNTYSTVMSKDTKYVYLPFSINNNNINTMLFINGKALSKHEYRIKDNLVELKDSTKRDSSFYILDFSTEDNLIPGDLSDKGTRTYEEVLDDNYTIHLPFVIIGSEDTNLIFADGILLSSDSYKINQDHIRFNNNIKTGSLIKVINFSSVYNLDYKDSQINIKDKKIIEHNELSNVWHIEHGLDTYPNIIAIDQENQVINSVGTKYPDKNSIILEFDRAVTGKVILS